MDATGCSSKRSRYNGDSDDYDVDVPHHDEDELEADQDDRRPEQPRRNAARPPHSGPWPPGRRELKPGSTGFLLTVNPRAADKAKREAESVVGHYVNDVLKSSGIINDNGELVTDAAANDANIVTVAADLAAQLSAVRSSTTHRPKRVGASAFVRELPTKVKGYLFFEVREPRAAEIEAEAELVPGDGADTTATSAVVAPLRDDQEAAATTDAVAPPASAAPAARAVKVNQLVGIVADAMFEDLLLRPRPVVRQTFKCYPIGASAVPTNPASIAAAARALAVQWRDEQLEEFVTSAADEGATDVVAAAEGDAAPLIQDKGAVWRKNGERTMVAAWISVAVRNNTNVEKAKPAIRSAIAEALPANTFLVQPFYTKTGAAAVAKTHPTMYVSVSVVHSVALVSVMPHYAERLEYNLHAVATDRAVKAMVQE